MSDTLPERKWCNDCHGYTHMPYCPSYESTIEASRQRTHCGQSMRYDAIENGDVYDGQQLTGTYHCERCCTMQPIYKPVVSEHEPAAQGGGEEWRGQGQFVSDCTETLSRMFAVYGSDNRFIAAFSDKGERDQIVSEHNQHQSLVAERELLRRLLKAVTSPTTCYCNVMSGNLCWHCEARTVLGDQKGPSA